MAKFILGKMVRLVLTVLAVSFFTFVLLDFLPGDIRDVVIPPDQRDNPEVVDRLTEKYRLDENVFIRYTAWLGDAASGDLGRSAVGSRDILDDIFARLPITFEIMFLTVGIGLGIALPLGIISGYRAGTRVDQWISGFVQICLSIPGFVMGLALIYFFSVKWNLLPSTGWNRITDKGIVENLRTAILPAMSLAVAELAVYTRVVRSDVITTLQEDYIQFAKAKGLSDSRILITHALRPSSLSLITIVGLNIGALAGGTVIVEQLFAIPGLGGRLLQAVFARDVLVVQGITVFIATTYVFINTMVDILYIAVDPRIRK